MKTQKLSSTEISSSGNEIGTIKETDKLAGFCDHCEKWYAFIQGVDVNICPDCGAKPSVKQGKQITTQRTLNVDAKKINYKNIAA